MAAVGSADISLFEDFRFDRRGGVLFRRDQQGVLVPLVIGSRAFDILGVLVEHPGVLVTRDEIMNVAWPGTVVEDGNLSVQISALRRVLDDGRSEGSLIQTVPGRGYRFVGQVTQYDPDPLPFMAPSPNGCTDPGRDLPAEPTVLAPPDNMGGPQFGARNGWHLRLGIVVLGLAICLTGVATAIFWTSGFPWFDKAVTSTPRLSVVVMPFANLSDDREQQHFADGITEDLTTDLSLIPGFLVISRKAASTYTGKMVDTKQIGRELGVRYVLEGSVRQSGNQIRVNVQLIEAEDNTHLWAERFDRDIGDLFALQNEITGRFANTLGLTLIRSEASRPTDTLSAQDYRVRARAAAARPFSREKYAEAIDLFERALAIDPQLPPSTKSALAVQYTGRVLDNMTDTQPADIARAEELIGQIFAMAPDTSYAHYAKGQLLRVQRRCAEAISEYEIALGYNRNSASALSHIAGCKILLGLIDEAIPSLEQAITLIPRDPQVHAVHFRLGQARLLQSRTEDAIVWLEKSRSTHPTYPQVHAWLAAAYGLKGETDQAAAALAEARRLGGEGFMSSIARVRANSRFETPAGRSLSDAIYFAGLRKAGVPENE